MQDLTAEHAAILRFLDEAERNGVPAGEKLAAFFFFLEKIHHRKEEEALFPLLFGTEALQVGGPMCMTFFTPRVIGASWPESYRELLRVLPEGDAPLGPGEFRRKVFETGSMLRIPIEDHVAGARAAQLVLEAQGAERERVFRMLANLLRDHIRREEECLFALFRRVLTREQREAYADGAAKIDEELGTAARIRDLFG
jgi:hemerythrin-like domain-containing protein